MSKDWSKVVEPRAIQTDQLNSALSAFYGLTVSAPLLDLGGSMSLNLLIPHPRKQVVRVYRPWVTPDRLAEIQRVRIILAQHGIPVQQPVSTLQGEPWIIVDGRLVEVEPFVAHNGKMDTWERLRDHLPMLGRIHTVLARVDVSAAGAEAPACNSISRETTLKQALVGLDRLRGLELTAEERAFADEVERFAHRIHDLERNQEPLSRQLVHGDFWDNNVFLRDEQIVQIADLDFMGLRERIDDLALTLYYTNSTFADGREDPGRISALCGLVDAYDHGLEHKLSAAERNALPLAMCRTPLAFVGQMAFADEVIVHRLVQELRPDFQWAARILDQPGTWQHGWSRAN